MTLIIPTPTTTNEEITFTINQKNYTFYFTCNERNKNKRWYVDIALENVIFISGIKILEGNYLFSDYIVPEFDHGNIACVRVTDTKVPCGKDNLGFDKDYALVYYTNAEIAEAQDA